MIKLNGKISHLFYISGKSMSDSTELEKIQGIEKKFKEASKALDVSP